MPRCLVALVLAGWALCFCAGCASFKYTPTTHAIADGSAGQGLRLAIATGHDLRPAGEQRPGWARDAEPIIARALAEELRAAKVFRSVRIHADNVKPEKYPEVIHFRVRKFQCFNQASFLESTGRNILRYQGLHGALIAESIPAKYTSEVDIDFEVFDSSSGRPVFAKSYSASRSDAFNGYQREKPKIEQTSEALSEVLSQFVADLQRAGTAAPRPR